MINLDKLIIIGTICGIASTITLLYLLLSPIVIQKFITHETTEDYCLEWVGVIVTVEERLLTPLENLTWENVEWETIGEYNNTNVTYKRSSMEMLFEWGEVLERSIEYGDETLERAEVLTDFVESGRDDILVNIKLLLYHNQTYFPTEISDTTFVSDRCSNYIKVFKTQEVRR